MNLFGISSIILSLAGIVFSFIVFRSDRQNRINQFWFVSCIAFSLWSFSLYVVTSTDHIQTAKIWQYVLDVSAIFLPATYFLFLSEFLKFKNRNLRIGMIIFAFAFALFSVTPLFKIGMSEFGEFFWVRPGPLYITFPIYFIFYALLSLGVMVRAYLRAPKGGVLRAQIRNLILGGIMGYGGGITNFFPQIFSVYPFGNYLVIFYIVFMVYGVIRYKMLSAKVISAQLFSTALGLVAIFNLLRSDSFSDGILNLFIFVLVILFSLLLVSSVNTEVKARQHIETLAQDLEKANIRLTELDRQKSEFVSFATHQLRAPLTAMKGYSSLLLDGDMGHLPEQARQGVSRIYDSTNTLVSIVNDYLNVSRIELGAMKFSFDTVDLKALVQDTLAELGPNIEKSKLAVNLTVAPGENDFRLKADRDKLKQVVMNILDNSIKYTPKGKIDIELWRDKARNKLMISIKDTGVGIPGGVLPKLFQKFSRADNASKTNIRGTGLGLYVAKQMVEAHHGTIKAESEGEGKGSTFTIELEPLSIQK